MSPTTASAWRSARWRCQNCSVLPSPRAAKCFGCVRSPGAGANFSAPALSPPRSFGRVLCPRPIPRRRKRPPRSAAWAGIRHRSRVNELLISTSVLRRITELASSVVPQLAVNAELNAADRQEIDIGFGLAGLDPVADPELPPPNTRRRGQGHGVVDAFVRHESLPPR